MQLSQILPQCNKWTSGFNMEYTNTHSYDCYWIKDYCQDPCNCMIVPQCGFTFALPYKQLLLWICIKMFQKMERDLPEHMEALTIREKNKLLFLLWGPLRMLKMWYPSGAKEELT